VKPAAFSYARANSIEQALDLLAQGEGEAKVLAGGQSLIATLNLRLSAPKLLVDINTIPGLDQIRLDGNALEIGALVRQADAEVSPLVAQHAPLIARALQDVAHPAIRNRGTIGGSIAFADPAAELPACLLALDGEVVIASRSGKRTVKADDFFTDLYETAVAPDELLVAVRVPAASSASRFGFGELSRRHGDYALVGLAAATQSGSALRDVRLGYFAVGATPQRAKNAEAALSDGKLDDAVAALARDLDPSDDIQSSRAYKLHAAGVLLRRVAREMMERR
jgi:carbon-monoxide dehydrogenase medium subunit